MPIPNLSLACLAALPVLTGLASVLWSMLVHTSKSSAALGNVVCYAIVFVLVQAFSSNNVPVAALLEGRNLVVFGAYVVTSILVSLAWIGALSGTHVAAIGLVEIGYPVFVILFSALLVAPVRLTAMQWCGGGLVFMGMVLVLAGSGQPAALPESAPPSVP